MRTALPGWKPWPEAEPSAWCGVLGNELEGCWEINWVVLRTVGVNALYKVGCQNTVYVLSSTLDYYFLYYFVLKTYPYTPYS